MVNGEHMVGRMLGKWLNMAPIKGGSTLSSLLLFPGDSKLLPLSLGFK